MNSVALYGAKCWPTTKTTKHLLHVMEMRMPRWILGFTRFDGIRNTTIKQEVGVTPVTEKMREYRLQWFGHLLRANTLTVVSIAYTMNVDGRQPCGRPKQRW